VPLQCSLRRFFGGCVGGFRRDAPQLRQPFSSEAVSEGRHMRSRPGDHHQRTPVPGMAFGASSSRWPEYICTSPILGKGSAAIRGS